MNNCGKIVPLIKHFILIFHYFFVNFLPYGIISSVHPILYFGFSSILYYTKLEFSKSDSSFYFFIKNFGQIPRNLIFSICFHRDIRILANLEKFVFLSLFSIIGCYIAPFSKIGLKRSLLFNSITIMYRSLSAFCINS